MYKNQRQYCDNIEYHDILTHDIHNQITLSWLCDRNLMHLYTYTAAVVT